MIALYARVSTQEQAKEGYSIDEQVARLESYARSFGYSSCETFIDAGYSGATMDRPALQKIISAALDHRVDRVIVYKLDRLSRSQKDTLAIIEDIFLANGVEFVSITENFDTSSPFGRAMIGILAVFAQLEREQIRERMQLGKEGRAKEGKWQGGGLTPIGYDYADGSLQINEFEALQIREMFDLYIAGHTAYEIERIFLEKGYKHKYGTWSNTRITKSLQNRIYIGELRYHGKFVQGAHEPIVQRSDFEKAQEVHAIRTSSMTSTNAKTGRYSTYLGGLVFCARCGGRYGATQQITRGKKYRYYACYSKRKINLRMVHDQHCDNKTYRMEVLDAAIFSEIQKLAMDPEALQELQQRAEDPSGPSRQQVIQKELEKISARRSRLIDLYTAGSFERSDLDKKASELSAQEAALTDELRRISSRSETNQKARATITSFSDLLQHGTFQEIRLAIETLIDRIEIDGDEISIYWRFV